MRLETLNDHYAIEGHIRFIEGVNGLTKAVISNPYADAELYLFGAHITRFRPHGELELLWMSPDALFAPPKAIRGGVPICWPWFGKDPDHPDRVQHGFARNRHWDVVHSSITADGETHLRLRLQDDAETMLLWPFAFRLELHLTVGKRLKMELVSTNTDEKEYTIGGALHTYFQVDDIATVKVHGLEDVTYIDTTDDHKRISSDTPITFTQETDRIYLDTDHTCTITDHTTRKLLITKAGSKTTVVWNPWQAKAQAMQDFSDDGYTQMLCIESVNTLDDAITLRPGQSHTLGQTIAITR